MRDSPVGYLDDFIARGNATAFAYRKGVRTVHWSYKQIAHSALAFARLLEANQIKKGDRVILCGENSPEWIVAFFGSLLFGAIVVPLDVQSESGFVRRVQQQVRAKLAVFDTVAARSFILPLPVVSFAQLTAELLLLQFPESAQLGQSLNSSFPQSADSMAEIVFTSGTTAEPKGVVITHGNLMANLAPLEARIRPYLKWERMVHPIRFLNLLPLSHVFGQFMGIFVPQLLGSQVFFSDSLKPSEIIKTVKRERISVIACVPRMLETMRERIEWEYEEATNQVEGEGRQKFIEVLHKAEKWSVARRWWAFRRAHRMFGLKFWAFISGGATLDAETEDFWQRLGFAIIQGYGMTETASLISVNHPFKKTARSIGAVMPGQQVRLSPNGEILVRGPNVSPGYWDPTTDKPREGVVGRRGEPGSEEDGWLHTGDVGVLDAEGNLYFKGRKKEVLVSSAGMNVYPEDIEAVLNRQPEIKASVVVGVAGSHGPEPVAVLILRNAYGSGNVDRANTLTAFGSNDPQIARLIEKVNRSLAEHQRILRWVVWPEKDFPRTATQKVRKQLVAETVEANLMQASRLRLPDMLRDILTRVSGEAPGKFGPTAKLATDLKLDSLARVELLGAIEDRYQVDINEATFDEATTVADVEQIIREGQSKTVAEGYPYPHWPHRWPVDWLRIALLYSLIFPLVRWMGRARVLGREHLQDKEGPLLFIANHLTMVDHALILWALPGRFRRRMSIAMDGEILREWLHPSQSSNWFTRLRYWLQYVLVAFFFNVFAMPQHSGFRQSFNFAGEMMDRNYSVLVFPEGRRSPDSQLGEFRAGIGLLAKQLHVPIVPIRIDGLHELSQQRRHFAPYGAITVTIGKPINEVHRYEVGELVRYLQQRVRNP